MTTDDHRVTGRIVVHPRGFGFLEYDGDDGPASTFVAPPDLNPYVEGDEVSARVELQEDGRTRARGLRLERRFRLELFGELTRHKGKPHLRIDRELANTDWPLEGIEEVGLEEGDLLVARIHGVEQRATALRRVDGARASLERVVVRHGLRPAFPEPVLQAARDATQEVGHRRDLRDVPTVTIDAPSTRDLDDALAVIPAGADGALRVFVSIADVDSVVGEGSALDEEARLRGTSVYLAGRVLPMLPPSLSEERLSLLEGQERLAMTVELRLDAEGEVRSVDLYPSRIRSTARLSYEGVAAYLDRGEPSGVPEAVRETVRWLRTASARLSMVRGARGGIEMTREDTDVTLDDAGEPTRFTSREDDVAHQLVERLMVAANEAVATWLRDRGLPAVYRVHPEPEPERVARLVAFVRNFGIEAGFGPRLSPRMLAALEAQFRHADAAPAIRSVVLKSLGPARYTLEAGSHFGLAAPLYLHFTSPIRRYADLMVHRVVKRFLAGDRSLDPRDPGMTATASDLNDRAAAASKAEKERLRMLAARFMAGRVGEVAEGDILRIKHFGLVIQIVGSGVTGSVATEALPGGPYERDRASQALRSPDRTFEIGQRVRVRVESTDEDQGRIELSLVP